MWKIYKYPNIISTILLLSLSNFIGLYHACWLSLAVVGKALYRYKTDLAYPPKAPLGRQGAILLQSHNLHNCMFFKRINRVYITYNFIIKVHFTTFQINRLLR